MAKTDVLAIASLGSRALKNAKYERYCRLRASAQPRIPAYRAAGWETSDDDDAYSNACRLERRPGIRDRIAYLTRTRGGCPIIVVMVPTLPFDQGLSHAST
jgi:hypothetical protein